MLFAIWSFNINPLAAFKRLILHAFFSAEMKISVPDVSERPSTAHVIGQYLGHPHRIECNTPSRARATPWPSFHRGRRWYDGGGVAFLQHCWDREGYGGNGFAPAAFPLPRLRFWRLFSELIFFRQPQARDFSRDRAFRYWSS